MSERPEVESEGEDFVQASVRHVIAAGCQLWDRQSLETPPSTGVLLCARHSIWDFNFSLNMTLKI